MTMLKQTGNSIYNYMKDERDVDELIFGTETFSAGAEDTCSDR